MGNPRIPILGQHPEFRLVFHNPRRVALRAALFGHIGLLESWFDGDVDLEGDLKSAFAVGYASELHGRPRLLVSLRNRWHEWRFSNAQPRPGEGQRALPLRAWERPSTGSG